MCILLVGVRGFVGWYLFLVLFVVGYELFFIVCCLLVDVFVGVCWLVFDLEWFVERLDSFVWFVGVDLLINVVGIMSFDEVSMVCV